MRLPTLWIAAACAAGIEACRLAQLSPGKCALAAAIAILAAAILLWRRQAAIAWALALLAWVAIGATAASLQRSHVASDNVARLIAQGRIDVSSPLRWHGRLRNDAADRPWGEEYLIDLDRVEIAGNSQPVSGGLRLTLYGDGGGEEPDGDFRAGDRVEALVKAQPPKNFNDPGSFDARAYLASQGIDLAGSLRNAALLALIDHPAPGLQQRLARVHGTLLKRIDALFAGQPERAALLRAMLLGDRSFVDTTTAVAFQKTAAFHVLVVAGLHTGAIVLFVLWLCRRLRIGIWPTIFVTLAVLAAYVGVVEDRPPILRASLMAALYLLARPFFRRVDLVNSVAIVALGLALWNPALVSDSSFQLSFLAAAVIAGLAVPWMQRTTAPYRAGLAHLGDVTRDVIHPPKIAQFRIETRAAVRWIAGRLPRRLSRWSASIIATPMRMVLRLCELFLLSIAIQIGMLPLLAQDFHRVSISGPISNIPAVLLTGIIVPLGFLCLVLSFIWTRAAAFLARFLSLFSAALLHSIEWFSSLPHLSYRIPGPPSWLIIAFFVALAAFAAIARRVVTQRRGRIARRKLPPAIAWQEFAVGFVLAALALVIATYPLAPRLAKGRTEVTVLDVGQGDSLFVSFPRGETMLVDGGGLAGSEWIKGMRSAPDVGEQVVSPYLWSRGIKHLDVIALTHAHEDHLGGLPSVIENFSVGELWIGRDENTPEFRAFLAEAHRRGVRIIHKTEGEDLVWGEVRGKVLWPPVENPTKEASNDDSLVMRIEDGQTSFLLTGDIEQPEENKILAEGEPLTSDFLKVPHHGSKTSSTEPFLEAVRPRIAVVSVGTGNAYGHPSQTVVERYAQDGVQLLRTDRDGAVTASSDGRTISVQAFVPREKDLVLAQAGRQVQ